MGQIGPRWQLCTEGPHGPAHGSQSGAQAGRYALEGQVIHAETERLWREVLAECPGDREALAKLNGVIGAKPAAPANPDSFDPTETRHRRSSCP